jgi:hypothetical protein
MCFESIGNIVNITDIRSGGVTDYSAIDPIAYSKLEV